MKNSGKNMMKLAIVILIVTIIILVGIIIKILNTNNEINRQKERNTQQFEETTTDNAYISMEAHLSALDEKQKEINNMQNTAGQATVTADKILKDYTAYKDGKLITGTMANNGAVTKALNAGGSYTIPAGYHNGSGKVTANSLASQTSATATASDILSGKTAWVNGKLVTGSSTAKSEFVHNTFNAPTYNETQTINIGFKPNALLILNKTAGYTFKATYMDGVTYCYYANSDSYFSSFVTLTDNGFIFKCPPSMVAQGDYEYYAYKYN